LTEADWINVTNKTNLARAVDCIRDIVVIEGSPIDEKKLDHIEKQLLEIYCQHFPENLLEDQT